MMQEKFDAIVSVNDGTITSEEPVADEIAAEILVDDSNLTVTDATEEFIDVFDSSNVTEEEQEEAADAIVEEIVEDNSDRQAIPNNIQEILIAFITNLSIAGSPGSDVFQFGSTGTNIISGREGNDVILGVDPEANLPGQSDLDIFTGGTESDTFVLGDRNKPYYNDGDGSTTGDSSLAIISDFNLNEDIIRLHGSPEDYVLVDFADLGEGETGTAIFLKGETDELIASLDNATGLSLDADYFEFASGSAQPAAIGEVSQFGTEGIDLSFSVNNSEDRFNAPIIAGYTTGTLGARDRGGLEGFVTRYNNRGEQQWTQQIGTRNNDTSYGIDIDAQGNIYSLSRTNGRLGGANAGIGNDIVFSKYARTGRELFQVQFGSFSLDNGFVDPSVNNAGDIVIAGYTSGGLGGPNASPDIPPGTDAWIAKYDDSGNQIWLEQFGTPAGDETFGLDTDSEDNIYATGWTTGDLGGANAGIYDIWLAKYDTNGEQQWVEQFGTGTFDWSWDVATDINDDTYITGWTLGDLGGTNAGSYDVWVAKYDSEGNQQMLTQFGTTGDDAALGIDTDDEGNYYLTGYTDGDLTGEGNAGSYDAWVAKYDGEGNQIWIEQFGSSGLENAYEVSVSAGSVFVTGTTDDSLGAVNAGSYDGWIAELSAADGALVNF